MTKKYAFTIVAIVKNEGWDIAEWIQYHSNIGVDHFYLIDNDSEDDTVEEIKSFDDINITFRSFPGSGVQLDAYRVALSDLRNATKWISFIDADEYIRIPKDPDLDRLLSDLCGDASGVALYWKTFLPSPKPKWSKSKLSTQDLCQAFPTDHTFNNQVKSILKTDDIISIRNHVSLCKRDIVNEHGELFKQNGELARFTSHDRLYLNHYRIRSAAHLVARATKGDVLGGKHWLRDDLPRAEKSPSLLDDSAAGVLSRGQIKALRSRPERGTYGTRNNILASLFEVTRGRASADASTLEAATALCESDTWTAQEMFLLSRFLERIDSSPQKDRLAIRLGSRLDPTTIQYWQRLETIARSDEALGEFVANDPDEAIATLRRIPGNFKLAVAIYDHFGRHSDQESASGFTDELLIFGRRNTHMLLRSSEKARQFGFSEIAARLLEQASLNHADDPVIASRFARVLEETGNKTMIRSLAGRKNRLFNAEQKIMDTLEKLQAK